jgi:hypothetical protein
LPAGAHGVCRDNLSSPPPQSPHPSVGDRSGRSALAEVTDGQQQNKPHEGITERARSFFESIEMHASSWMT